MIDEAEFKQVSVNTQFIVAEWVHMYFIAPYLTELKTTQVVFMQPIHHFINTRLENSRIACTNVNKWKKFHIKCHPFTAGSLLTVFLDAVLPLRSLIDANRYSF